MPGNAALTPAAMFASQWSSDHARNTKVGLIKLPEADQLVDNGLLFGDSIELRHETRIVDHTPDIKPGAQGIGEDERKVHQPRTFY